MSDHDIYRDISSRTDGAVMLGVVGPVRTGKSTFIKQFMETLVIPNIDDVYMRERARDELPQSGSGRTIMTSEPKFVPEEAVSVVLEGGTELSVRLVDCVGYMVNGASGQLENGEERLVTTPWFDHEVSMTEAAESGTRKVIAEHSTIGLVVTTDGSICDIPRADYTEPEERVISELKELGKPFSVIVNSAYPQSREAVSLTNGLSEKYGVTCRCLNLRELSEKDIEDIMSDILGEFPLSEIAVTLPSWVEHTESGINESLYGCFLEKAKTMHKVRDTAELLTALNENENVELAEQSSADMGSGIVGVRLEVPKELYYKLIADETGFDISDDGELYGILKQMSEIRKDYEHIKKALDDVRDNGYGVIYPDAGELRLDEPRIVKQGGRYTVKLKANAPAIHLFKTAVEAEVRPKLGGEGANEEILSFLLQGYEGDMSKLWSSNIFGKSLYELAGEGINAKLAAVPENARAKLQDTFQRLINDGGGTLICFLF